MTQPNYEKIEVFIFSKMSNDLLQCTFLQCTFLQCTFLMLTIFLHFLFLISVLYQLNDGKIK